MFYDDDIDVWFDEFAQDVTYTASGVAAATISAIFDAPGTIQRIGAAAVLVDKPQITVKATDVPAPTLHDTAVVGGVTYKVTGYTPDGTGVTIITLAEESR